ncbi:hypothetical protein MBANPS3_012570 [Mucor bainieri]
MFNDRVDIVLFRNVGNLTDAEPLNDRIIGQSISLQTKCTYSGLRPNLFVSNYALMFYYLEYFSRKTRHNFARPLNACVYTNEDDAFAFVNMSINFMKVRPYAIVHDNNNVISSAAIRINVEDEDYENDSTLKLKQIIPLYIWQNIADENMMH